MSILDQLPSPWLGCVSLVMMFLRCKGPGESGRIMNLSIQAVRLKFAFIAFHRAKHFPPGKLYLFFPRIRSKSAIRIGIRINH
jgi:hypothetical protein